jgi:hypothetical protein
MTIPFQAEDQLLPVSDWLKTQLAEQVAHQRIDLAPLTALTFRFSDPNYSPTQGGYHPVEIRLVRGLNGWLFDTITDFSYQGYGDWAELDKELDFDFLSPEFAHIYLGILSIDDAVALYCLWESNFWLYCQTDALHTSLALE